MYSIIKRTNSDALESILLKIYYTVAGAVLSANGGVGGSDKYTFIYLTKNQKDLI